MPNLPRSAQSGLWVKSATRFFQKCNFALERLEVN